VATRTSLSPKRLDLKLFLLKIMGFGGFCTVVFDVYSLKPLINIDKPSIMVQAFATIHPIGGLYPLVN
jgi:hypothetical protein